MSILENLVGTSWALVQYQSENKAGQIIYPLGKDARGTIIFTHEQQTAVQIMSVNRKDKVPEEALASYNTNVEKEMARQGYHAYTGPFTVDEDSGVLTTHVSISLMPDYVGTKQARKATIEGDILKLFNVNHPERKIIWRKIQ